MKPSALTACVLCLTSLSVSAAMAQRLDGFLAQSYGPNTLPALAAAVVRAAKSLPRAVGTRVLGTDSPVTIDDRFHLGSDAKALTATLVR
jgi:CubicO group peptidase (beta-lactamase class C family)